MVFIISVSKTLIEKTTCKVIFYENMNDLINIGGNALA